MELPRDPDERALVVRELVREAPDAREPLELREVPELLRALVLELRARVERRVLVR